MKSAVAVSFPQPSVSDTLAPPHFLRLHRAESEGVAEVTAPAQHPVPPFRPHVLVRGGHAQTISGLFFPGDIRDPQAARHIVRLEDGDAVVLHDEIPTNWRPGGPCALLVHGLTGDASSSYMIRTARKLCDRGVRAFRMDMRSAGAAWGLSRRPYHAGCSSDVRVALDYIAELTDGGPTGLVGYSLGGNIILKLLGERPDDVPATLARAIAINPSIELAACSRGLERPINRIYAKHFVKAMCRHLVKATDLIDRHKITALSRTVRFIREFDDLYTAPMSGFKCVDEYYAACSAARFASNIRIPTLIVAAEDDPLVPADVFRRAAISATTQVHLAPSGGHLGFIGRSGVDRDRRWMDWRVVDYIAGPKMA